MEIAGKCFEIEEEFKYLGRQMHVKIGIHFTYVLRAHQTQGMPDIPLRSEHSVSYTIQGKCLGLDTAG
jgi:hypothetical protein